MLNIEEIGGRSAAAPDHAGRLERSVAATLQAIAAARAEREAPPIHAARVRLAAVYGMTRLARMRERAAEAV